MKIRNLFKNIKIGKKLTLTFILVTLISSISGIIGFTVMTSMNAQYSRAFVNYGFSQGDIGMFNTEFNNNLIIVRDMIIQTDSTQMLKSKKQLDQSNTKLSQYLTKMQSGMVNAKEKGYYNTIRDSMTDYAMARDQAVQLAISNQDQEAYQTLSDNCTPLSDKIRYAIDALVTEKTNTGNQVSKSLNMRSIIADVIMLAVLLFAMALSVIIAVLISRGISKPVSELVTAASRMAQGDLTVKINVKSKDEIGQLGVAFMNTIEILNTYITDIKTKLAKVEKGDLTVARDFEYKGDFVELINSIEAIVAFMNDTVTQMRQAAQQVAGGSEQVSSGAQALAQGATLQASSIEQLSATTTEITTDLKENAEHVTNVSVSVNDVSSEIETCNQHMQQMVQAMSKINDSSNQIGAIIKTIEDIAFQTNILALNAAVEAARAGEAGKGFAVVADEVRNLASRSATAAKDTTLLIQNSIGEVENGTKITNETAEILIRVVENARAVSDMVGQISQATTKQAGAIQQINSGVEQISNVIQTNSATAEESAAASEELAGQAQTMKALAERFKLTKQG